MTSTIPTTTSAQKIRVSAVDPGHVNPAAWIGTLHFDTNKIETDWGVAGADITDVAAETRASSLKGSKGGPTICEVGAQVGQLIVSKCEEMGIDDLEGIVVETPSTFNGKGAFVNVGAAVGAGATYGYLCGHGVRNVRMSHSRTKSKAMEYFAEHLGITLEQHVPGTDKAAKAKNRLINKRNAKKVITELLKFSDDAKGAALLERHHDKKDDIADAILLACGLGLDMQPKRRVSVKGKKKKKST